LFNKLDGFGGGKWLAEQAIEAQIRIMNASADKLKSSADAMNSAAELTWRSSQVMWQTSQLEKTIKIAMAGVEPEIEAFMWKILKKIQVRANEAGAEFLLAAAT